MCARFTELVTSFRNELVQSFDSYIHSKISTFRLQVGKLEAHKTDLRQMHNDISSNAENISKAPEEYLSSSRFLLIVDKFDSVSGKLRSVS